MRKPSAKPPIGIMPSGIAMAKFNAFRIGELTAGISRYAAANLSIPAEWIEELSAVMAAHNLYQQQ